MRPSPATPACRRRFPASRSSAGGTPRAAGTPAGDLGHDRLRCAWARRWRQRGRLLLGDWEKITDRYWVPTSGPWRFLCVGSCASQNFEQLLVADLLGVELDLDRLRVARRAGADVLVGRTRVPAGVADGGRIDAWHLRNAASTPQKQPAANVAFCILPPVRAARRIDVRANQDYPSVVVL